MGHASIVTKDFGPMSFEDLCTEWDNRQAYLSRHDFLEFPFRNILVSIPDLSAS